jgi:Abortive infection C-terminus
MADAPTVRFIMHGARAAIAGGMLHIEEQVAGIERAVVENPGLAFDLAKTLIESACRTILAERRIAFDPGDDLPKLFKTASQNLPFLPISASGAAEIRKSLAQTLNGLHTAIQGICELRNQCGFASHGADGPRPALEAVQALLAAEAADTIIGFLHRVHQQDGAAPASSPSTYDDNPEFNNYVDEVHERVRIFDEEFEPSRILF